MKSSTKNAYRIKADNAAMRALRHAWKTGAPFTEEGDAHHEACVRLQKAGVLRCAQRVGSRHFWVEVG